MPMKTKLLLIATSVGLIFVFANPLKTLSSEKKTDMLIGTAIALAVLSVVGAMYWQVVRFFDSDDEGKGD